MEGNAMVASAATAAGAGVLHALLPSSFFPFIYYFNFNF